MPVKKISWKKKIKNFDLITKLLLINSILLAVIFIMLIGLSLKTCAISKLKIETDQGIMEINPLEVLMGNQQQLFNEIHKLSPNL